jgi:hypothetical protein
MPYKDREYGLMKNKIRSKKSYEKLKEDELFRKRRKFTMMKKSQGIKGDYEEIWRLYENTDNCQSCNKIMINGRGRDGKCTDHHHASGYFRHIICNSCNNYRAKHDRMMLSILLEIHRYHLRR